EGLVLAVILAFVARPLVVGSLLLPVRLRWGEHLFVMWGGLKGAVPIVLGSFVLLADVPESQEIYGIVFVVVTFSVIFQGASVPSVARRLGVPMEEVQPEPWDVKVRFKSEPRGVHRLGVGHGSPASGSAIRELAIGSDTWISLVVREGRPVQARGDEVLQPGDEVLLLTDEEDVGSIRGVFDSPLRRPPR
ncbi:MAG: cation:proton antiporter, partial [Gaiellales bacterium]